MITIADSKFENEVLNQDFQPLLIAIQNIHALIVNDYEWEVIKNPFLKHPSREDENVYISTLFEILRIQFSAEKFTHKYKLQAVDEDDEENSQPLIKYVFSFVLFMTIIKSSKRGFSNSKKVRILLFNQCFSFFKHLHSAAIVSHRSIN